MKIIEDKIQAMREFDPDQAIVDVAVENSDTIREYVTELQLYLEGVRGSDGAVIMDYDPYKAVTIAIKTHKGHPTDRVTLRDTGDFHAGFEVRQEADGFLITSTDTKTDELKDRYGEGIMALTDDNLAKVLKEIIYPALKQAFVKAWNDG